MMPKIFDFDEMAASLHPGIDQSDNVRSGTNDAIHNNFSNQQQSESNNRADAKKEQGNNGGDVSQTSIQENTSHLHLDASRSNSASSSQYSIKQPAEFCSRSCLTGLDSGTGSLILHEAVFSNNVEWICQILNNKELAQKTVNKKDKHGNTPLHLACMLGRSKDIVQALLESGASIESKNLNRWTPFHEACSYGNREIITLMTKQLESDVYNALNKNKLSDNLEKTKNYCITLRWKFESWVPLITRYLPNDLCKITKHGRNIRIDTGLFDYGMDHHGYMSGNSRDCCLIYNHNFEKKWAVLNHKSKKFQHLDSQIIEKKNIEEGVDAYMSIDIIDLELKSNDIQLTRSTSGWIWKVDKTDQIGKFAADIYNFDNVFLVTKKRREHLTEKDMERNKVAYKAFTAVFKHGKMPVLEADDEGDNEDNENDNFSDRQKDDDDESAVTEHRESLRPPPTSKVTWEQYLESEPGDFPILGRKHVCKTSTTAFKASVAMSKDFPIDKSEFLDLLSIVPMKMFKKLKEIIEMRLPEGFPIRLDVPIFLPFLTSRITIEDFKFIERQIDESLFTIPNDYQEDPNLYPRLAGQKRN